MLLLSRNTYNCFNLKIVILIFNHLANLGEKIAFAEGDRYSLYSGESILVESISYIHSFGGSSFRLTIEVFCLMMRMVLVTKKVPLKIREMHTPCQTLVGQGFLV